MDSNKNAKSFPKQQKIKSFKGKSNQNKNNKHQKKEFSKTISRSDRENAEIEKLSKQIQDLSTNCEESKSPITKFDDLPLSKYTRRALKEANFVTLTEVQQKTMLSSLSGHDIVGTAKTGSGKTLAYLIPLLECLYREKWSKEAGLGAIIISPTRELALQIFDVLRTVGKYHSFSAGLVIGGKDFAEEQSRLTAMNILVCTPGRILQHMEQSPLFNTDNVRMLVIDECDRCLDMGFKPTLQEIINNLNTDRQTLLYSATNDDHIKDFISECCQNPEYLTTEQIDDYSTPANLIQKYIVCELDAKIEILYAFLRSHLKSKILVFLNSCKEVRFLYESFRRMKPGIPLMELQGRQKQTMRTYIYYDYLQKEQACLFCTDIAARGLDFPNIDWVIQYDAPSDAATYIHRVGRTARYKSKGNSLLFLCTSEEEGELEMLADKRIPLKKISVNPSKTQSIVKKITEEVSKDTDLRLLAQKAFSSYLRSIYLFKNTAIFDITKLDLGKFAQSLGLGIVPPLDLSTKNNKNKSWAMIELEKEMNGKTNSSNPIKETTLEDDDSDDDLLVSVKNSKYDINTISNSIQNNIVVSKNPEKKKLKIKLDRITPNKKITFTDEGDAVQANTVKVTNIKDIAPIQETDIESHRDAIKRRLEEGEEETKRREQQRVAEKKLKKKLRKNNNEDMNEEPIAMLGDDNDDENEDENEDNDQDMNSDNESDSE